MTITARFYVESYTRRAYNPDHVDVTLRAAGRGEQNKAWAQDHRQPLANGRRPIQDCL